MDDERVERVNKGINVISFSFVVGLFGVWLVFFFGLDVVEFVFWFF